jgi:hypothetical protein
VFSENPLTDNYFGRLKPEMQPSFNERPNSIEALSKEHELQNANHGRQAKRDK